MSAPHVAADHIIDYGHTWYVGDGSLVKATNAARDKVAPLLVSRYIFGSRLNGESVSMRHCFASFDNAAELSVVLSRIKDGECRLCEVISRDSCSFPHFFLRITLSRSCGAEVAISESIELALSCISLLLATSPCRQDLQVYSTVYAHEVILRMHVTSCCLDHQNARLRFAASLLAHVRGIETITPSVRDAFVAFAENGYKGLIQVPLTISRFNFEVSATAEPVEGNGPASDSLLVIRNRQHALARLFQTSLRVAPKTELPCQDHDIAMDWYDAMIDEKGKPRVKPYEIGNFKVIVEASPMGGGKTEQWVNVLTAHSDRSSLGIFPRCLLEVEHGHRGHHLDLVSYKDIPSSLCDAGIPVSQHRRCTTVVNSLYRFYTKSEAGDVFGGDPTYIMNYNAYDFVFLDEINTIIASLGGLITDPSTYTTGWKNLEAMSSIMCQAGLVIVADAQAGKLASLFIKACGIDKSQIQWRCFKEKPHGDRRFQFVYPINESGQRDAIGAAVELIFTCRKKGQHVHVPCARKDHLLEIEKRLRQLLPHDNIVALYAGDTYQQSSNTNTISLLRDGKLKPDIFFTTSLFGVGNSYDFDWFHVCVAVYSAKTLSPEMMAQLMHRVRTLSPTLEESPNSFIVCDSDTNDYVNMGAPWTSRPIDANEYQSKVNAGLVELKAKSIEKALVKLYIEHDILTAAEYVRVIVDKCGKKKYWSFFRQQVPPEISAEALQDRILMPPRFNNALRSGIEHMVLDAAMAVKDSDLTEQFKGQSGHIKWIAEYTCQTDPSNMKATGVRILTQHLINGGSVVFAPLVMQCGERVIDASDPVPIEVDLPSLSVVLECVVQRGVQAHESPLSLPLMEALAYSRATYGSPNGASWVRGGMEEDGDRAYLYEPSAHLDRGKSKRFRSNCAMQSAESPRDYLVSLRTQYTSSVDLNHIGHANPFAKRVTALDISELLGFSSVFGKERLNQLLLTNGVVLSVQEYIGSKDRKKGGCRICSRSPSSAEACETCAKGIREKATSILRDEFGVQLRNEGSRKRKERHQDAIPQWTLTFPKHWPECGPTKKHFDDYKIFAARMKDARLKASLRAEKDERAKKREQQRKLKKVTAHINRMICPRKKKKEREKEKERERKGKMALVLQGIRGIETVFQPMRSGERDRAHIELDIDAVICQDTRNVEGSIKEKRRAKKRQRLAKAQIEYNAKNDEETLINGTHSSRYRLWAPSGRESTSTLTKKKRVKRAKPTLGPYVITPPGLRKLWLCGEDVIPAGHDMTGRLVLHRTRAIGISSWDP